MERLRVKTSQRTQYVDITDQIRKIVAKSGLKSGICQIFVPHTTAGITINENADPDVVDDITKTLDKLVPWSAGYAHSEGNSAAHIKAGLTGFSQMIIVEGGELQLGTWQGVYFTEYDGPRTREVWVKTISG